MNRAQAIKGGALAGRSGPQGERLRLDRRFLLFLLLAAMLLSWPMLLFGRPIYTHDSAAYYKGGRAAVSFLLAKLGEPEAAATGAAAVQQPNSAAPSAENPAREASGVRSIPYSVATYLLSSPGATLALLAVAQALAAGLVILATLGLFGGLPARRTAIALALLAGTTTVAFASMLAVPDIFAGLLIGSIVLLTVGSSRLSLALRLLLTGIAAFAVTAHASHMPLAGGLTVLGLGWAAVCRYRKRPLPPWTWAWVAAPLVIGGLTTLAVNRVAFGETSLTSKRYPFALARSVNDGPGRWYLERNCPNLRYAICELYPRGLPQGGALEFLWGPDGVVQRATPAQMDRIRAEEADVVLAAAREYSGYEMRRLTFNIVRQLVLFQPYTQGERLVLDPDGTPRIEPAPPLDARARLVIAVVTALSAALGAIWLVWAFARNHPFRPVIAFMFLGILGNAATCALFSAVAHRYQARVIWLIPLLALALRGSSEGRWPGRLGKARTPGGNPPGG